MSRIVTMVSVLLTVTSSVHTKSQCPHFGQFIKNISDQFGKAELSSSKIICSNLTCSSLECRDSDKPSGKTSTNFKLTVNFDSCSKQIYVNVAALNKNVNITLKSNTAIVAPLTDAVQASIHSWIIDQVDVLNISIAAVVKTFSFKKGLVNKTVKFEGVVDNLCSRRSTARPTQLITGTSPLT